MKVSLVIPAYNVESLIQMTIESVKSQTCESFECIIVDDFSTDGTRQVVVNSIKGDKRFKVIAHRANAGLSASRNTGLRFAKGKYVAFLDADDLLMVDSLDLRAKTLDTSDTDVIGTYAGSITIDKNCKIAPDGKVVNLKMIDFITAGANCPFNANQPMFKRSMFMKVGGFDHSLKQAEDYDMWMRVLRYGFKIIPTNKQLVTYRQTEGSMIRDNPLLHLDTSYSRFMDCYNSYEKYRFNDKIALNLENGLADYVAQLNIANRVLEFIGIAMAKGDSNELLVQRLVKYLPDYFDVIESHRPFKERIKKGLDRYFKENINFNDDKYKKFSSQIALLHQQFKDESNIGDDVDVYSRDYSFENIVQVPGVQKNISLVFFPHKDYHVYTISLLKKYFDELGIDIIVVDISMHYRDEGVIHGCKKYKIPYIGYSNFVLGNFKPNSIVVFNDWDPIIRSIVLSAKKSNIKTIGIVEGIQDYLDADTKQSRRAYQVVDHLFLPGEHDKKYFPSKNNLCVGGIPRIHEMYKRNIQLNKNSKVALINSNFSYGVLEEFRDLWLKLAVEGCKNAGYKVVISRHPADKGQLFNDLVTKKDFYSALDECDVLISRFASGILEAMAVGVMPVYFNPHNEQVCKFKDPESSAYPEIVNKLDLEKFLINYNGITAADKKSFEKFLSHHCGNVDKDMSLSIVNEIRSILDKKSSYNYELFYDSLTVLDVKSGCFNNLKTIRMLNENELSKTLDEAHDSYSSNIKDIAQFKLNNIQKLIFTKKYDEADALIEKSMGIEGNETVLFHLKSLVKNLKRINKV